MKYGKRQSGKYLDLGRKSFCKICKKEFISIKGNPFCSSECRDINDKQRAKSYREKRSIKESGNLTPYLKLRFEILSRDNFTCQYCGRKAPDVILHIDHIRPLSKNGVNNKKNLIVSCQECNLGKGDILLNENQIKRFQRISR